MLQKALFVALLGILVVFPIKAPIALILGLVFALFFDNTFEKYRKTWINWMLKLAVIGLGFGMNITETVKTGMDGLFLTISSIVFVIGGGYFLAKAFHLDRSIGHLISSGTAICGGSAIAAVAPLIKANEKQISLSLGIVFLLNSISLLVFPPIGHFFDLSQHQFGLWSAIAIHDTSSVVGAALTYGDEALKVATTVKLARVLWIIPLSFLTVFMFKGSNEKIKIPWFIVFFLTVIAINSIFPFPEELASKVIFTSKKLLVLVIFMVGSGLSVAKIKEAGWKPLAFGSLLWLGVSIMSLTLILAT